MVEDSDLFFFGDDLDAVLEALESNDIVDENFNEVQLKSGKLFQKFSFSSQVVLTVSVCFARNF